MMNYIEARQAIRTFEEAYAATATSTSDKSKACKLAALLEQAAALAEEMEG